MNEHDVDVAMEMLGGFMRSAVERGQGGLLSLTSEPRAVEIEPKDGFKQHRMCVAVTIMIPFAPDRTCEPLPEFQSARAAGEQYAKTLNEETNRIFFGENE